MAAPTPPPTEPAATAEPCSCACHRARCTVCYCRQGPCECRWHLVCRLKQWWAEAAKPPRI